MGDSKADGGETAESAPKEDGEKPEGAAATGDQAAGKEGDPDSKKDEKREEEKKEAEPTEEILHNPCRVLPAQKPFISFPREINGHQVRYVPLLKNRHLGFCLLDDTKPGEPEDLFQED